MHEILRGRCSGGIWGRKRRKNLCGNVAAGIISDQPIYKENEAMAPYAEHFDLVTDTPRTDKSGISLPNIFYRIDF